MTQVSTTLPRLADLIDLVPCSVGALALEPRRLLIVAQVGPALVEVDLPVAAEGVCEFGGSFYVLGEKTLQPVSLAGALGTAVDVQAQGPIAAATSGMVAVAPGGGLVLFNAAGTILAQRGTPRITAIAASGNTVFAVCGFEVRSFNAADGLREIDRLSVENLLGSSRAILSGTDLFVINDARNHKLRFDVSDPAALSLTSDTVGTAAWASETTLSTASPFDPQTTLRRIVVPFTDAPVGVSDHGLVQHTPAPLAITVTATKTPNGGMPPILIAFTATCSGGVAPLSYLWDFGDSTGSTEQNPSHTFSGNGDYTVTVTVTDAYRRTATGALSVAVGPATWTFADVASSVRRWMGRVAATMFGITGSTGYEVILYTRDAEGVEETQGLVPSFASWYDAVVAPGLQWVAIGHAGAYFVRFHKVDGAWELSEPNIGGDGGSTVRLTYMDDDGTVFAHGANQDFLVVQYPGATQVVVPADPVDYRFAQLPDATVSADWFDGKRAIFGSNPYPGQSDGNTSYCLWIGTLVDGGVTGTTDRFTHPDGWRSFAADYLNYPSQPAIVHLDNDLGLVAMLYYNPADTDECELLIYNGSPGDWSLRTQIPLTGGQTAQSFARISEDGQFVAVALTRGGNYRVFSVDTGQEVTDPITASNHNASLSIPFRFISEGNWQEPRYDAGAGYDILQSIEVS